MKKYSVQMQEAILSKVRDGVPVAEIASSAGVSRSTIYTWLKQDSVPTKPDGHKVTMREMNMLKHQAEKYRNMVQILHAVNRTITAPNQEKLSALEALYGQYEVHTLCEALCVPRGTFYNYIFRGKHGDTQNARRREELRVVINEIFHEYHQLFGAGKITAILRERGYITTDKLVAELMGEMGLQSINSIHPWESERRSVVA